MSVGSSPSQNCYFIRSEIDPNQWFVFEYRNQNDLFDEGIPGTGLLVARWNDTVPLDYMGMFANAFFDFYTQAHQYWIFRPGSDVDTVNGDIWRAQFSQESGRTSFGPTTDPHPYLTDGTPETSFEITDITENGQELTFHVHFLHVGLAERNGADGLRVWPNPVRDNLTVEGENVCRLELYNAVGGQVLANPSVTGSRSTLSVSQLPSGVYVLKAYRTDGTSVVRKVVVR